MMSREAKNKQQKLRQSIKQRMEYIKALRAGNDPRKADKIKHHQRIIISLKNQMDAPTREPIKRTDLARKLKAEKARIARRLERSKRTQK